MDIRQLQYLIALVQEEHFTRAAKVCNVTQPTLSERIRQLEDCSLDAGVTYLENEPVENSLSWSLYYEKYRLFVHKDHPLANREKVTWKQVAGLELCSLTQDMQNRRIIDAVFCEIGRRPEIKIESNSFINLCHYIQGGRYCAVLPENFSELVGASNTLKSIPILSPLIKHAVGLVVQEREPLPILVTSLVEVAKTFHTAK